jgi:D-lyxose ketol-isomerase
MNLLFEQDYIYSKNFFTVCQFFHEYFIEPQTIHWLQARKEGAVIDDYSSKARDLLDGLTNPKIVGKTKIAED